MGLQGKSNVGAEIDGEGRQKYWSPSKSIRCVTHNGREEAGHDEVRHNRQIDLLDADVQVGRQKGDSGKVNEATDAGEPPGPRRGVRQQRGIRSRGSGVGGNPERVIAPVQALHARPQSRQNAIRKIIEQILPDLVGKDGAVKCLPAYYRGWGS